MTFPTDCPQCDAANSLQPDGAAGKGFHWFICSCCSKRTLIGPAANHSWPGVRDWQGWHAKVD